MADFYNKTKRYYRFGEPRKAKLLKIYPYFHPVDSEQNPIVTMQTNGGDQKEVIMLGSNNYLGMTSHPKIKQAAIEAVEKWGVGTTGSRLLNGTMSLHIELEERLAEFIGTEEALVFSTGMQANLGAISASLTDKDEWVISDQQNHASIIDAIRLGKNDPKNKKIYKHNDMEDMEAKLKEVPKGKGLIITDGVFSMEGDVVPLDHLTDIAEDYGAGVYVDDAHAVGVLGPHGKGTAAHYGLTDKVDITMGTFSKSFASCGGFIAANKEIINWLKHKARSFIFSASPPPSTCATVSAILDIIEKDDSIRQNLLSVADRMREGLMENGFDIGNSVTPIIPIIVGKEMKMLKFYKKLFEYDPKGIFTNPVTYPATPKDRALLRTSYMATMNDELIDEALEIITKTGKEMGII